MPYITIYELIDVGCLDDECGNGEYCYEQHHKGELDRCPAALYCATLYIHRQCPVKGAHKAQYAIRGEEEREEDTKGKDIAPLAVQEVLHNSLKTVIGSLIRCNDPEYCEN